MKKNTYAILLVSLLFSQVCRGEHVNQIYWTDWGGPDTGVFRANADGTDKQQIVSAEMNSLDGLAIDPIENKLYIGTTYDLLRCDLDGSNLETIISGGSVFNFYDLKIDVTNRKMYWCEWIEGSAEKYIRRANLDGSGVETVYTSSSDVPHGIALNPGEGKLYWASDAIYKSNLNGSNRETLLSKFGSGHLDVHDIDFVNEKLYFSIWGTEGIWRSDLDGTNAEFLIDDKTASLQIDPYNDKLYWTSWAEGISDIRMANLDGSEVETVCTMGYGNSIALNYIPEPATLLMLGVGAVMMRRRK